VFAGAGFGADPIVAISVPVVDRNGLFAGIVEGSLHLERLARSAERVEKQMQMKVVVLDAADQVVWASKDLGMTALQSLSTHTWKLAAGGKRTGSAVRLTNQKADGAGGSWVVAHAQSGSNRWQVMTALPAAAVYGKLEGYYRQMTLFTLSAAVLCILLAMLISSIITGPLESIVRQLQTLSIQEPATLSFQLSCNAPLEVRKLARDIEMISAGLASSYDGLQEALEERLRLNRELTRLLAELKSRALELSDAKVRAEDANRAKSAFLSNLSHEIRTPLNAILGMLMMVEDTCTDDEQRRPLQSAIEAADRLQLMLSDMLHFSEADAGQIEVERLAFYPGAILDAVLAVHRKPLQEKSLHVSTYVDPQAKRRFWGDPAKIKQVLWQFMENAVKFTHRGSIRLAIIVHPGESENVQVRFEVSDTGVGISKQAQEKLFEPFTQADMSSTRKHGGTGLGLAICRKTVHRLGGTLGVQSESGLGSVFWFEVPLTPELLGQPASPALPGPSPNAGESAKGRILVVDDNKVNQKVAGRLVESAGYRVDVASDGEHAVDLASRNAYALILMDCQMPVMDGFAATAGIRALPGAIASVPIVAVTANVLDGDRDRCLACGMDDYLTKPLSKTELWRILGYWVGRTHPQAPPGVVASAGAALALLPGHPGSGEAGDRIDARH
jgi:signal transduction histidine kinase/ActR/RegA family two-component response regulator